ncbi:MAG TPA: helix-turn-helix domain-containing protein [Gemmatimonadaceae bacterium]|nr:helix-turn-helix domain-containing protein [Gemmatimonadaceae bacterium]
MDTGTEQQGRKAGYVEVQEAVAGLAATLTDAAFQGARLQWAALGATPDEQATSSAIIDPEALLLVSLWLIPREPALADTVHDWVAKWSDLLSVQRTRNIARSFPAATLVQLRAVAITAFERGKDFRWSPVIKGGDGAGDADTAHADVARSTDTRLPVGAARLAVERDALLVLRFRMAFGVGARADALAYLLARGAAWSTVTEIAQATGYTPSAIRRALDRMAEADIVMTVDDGATRYRCDAASWGALLGLQGVVEPWQYWLQHFAFIATFVEWADSIARRKLTGYAITEQLRAVARGFRPTDDRDELRSWDGAFRDGSSMDEMTSALLAIAAPMLRGS